MTIEIRELVIEARVVAGEDAGGPTSVERRGRGERGAVAGWDAASEARLVASVVRRVLKVLDDRRERFE